MKVSNFFKYISVFLLLYFFGIEGVKGQSQTPQDFAIAKRTFGDACPTPTYNGENTAGDGFGVTFRWNPNYQDRKSVV